MTRRNLLRSALGVVAVNAQARSTRATQNTDTPLRIAISNQSSVDLPQTMVDALQQQLDQHFYPIWGKSASLRLIDAQTQPDPGEVPCTILDYTDSPSMVSYHFVTDDGSPYIKIFAMTGIYYGRAVSALLSHEIIETIVNPYFSFYTLADNGNGSGCLYNLEVCDPVQCSYYEINGFTVSDFVTPDFYQHPANKVYDYLKLLNGPLTTTVGGTVPMKTIQGLPSIFGRDAARPSHNF